MDSIQLNFQLYSQLKEGKAFALYSLPGKGIKDSEFLRNCKVDILYPGEINQAEGFLFAPYDAFNRPIYLFSQTKDISTENSKTEIDFFNDSNGEKIPEISQKHFEESIIQSQKMMTDGNLKKVVLSRPIIINNTDAIQRLGSIFAHLCEWYPSTLKYLVFTPCGQLWMGATPETLVSIKDSTSISTMSLSGTKKANQNIEWMQKEMDEHQWVADYIENVLNNCGCRNIKKEDIKTISAGPVEHLQTDFTATIDNHDLFIDLIFGLHPTPAVCGYPLEQAKEFISKSEGYDRAHYTGFLGPVSRSHIDLFVNLRCMQLFPNKVVLYVGAGITRDSIPELEWKETDLKSKTLLRAIEKIANFAAAKNR